MRAKITIPILFENDDFLVINKPAGLIVHTDGRTTEPSVVDWILKKYPALKEVGEPLIIHKESKNPLTILRPGIIHRLDRETSGALIIVKNNRAFENLKKQFKRKEVRKIYETFVYGDVKQDDGWIDRPIGRSKNDFRRYTAERGTRGELREALTYYHVFDRRHGASFLEVQPKTGRTHQIRVHLKAISHPVVCDSLYAPKRPSLFGFERTALHAKSITFTNIEGEKVSVVAPYPADFAAALKEFKKA